MRAAGASVLLGVDGTAHGRRRRARFVGSNRHVPLIVVAVGAAERIAAALPEADALLGEPVRTLERVRVCKRDGAPHTDAPPGWWLKLTVIGGRAVAGRRRFALIDRLTGTDGLVLSERVPAFRASGPGITLGGLRLGGPD